jgi:hypothetical protein
VGGVGGLGTAAASGDSQVQGCWGVAGGFEGVGGWACRGGCKGWGGGFYAFGDMGDLVVSFTMVMR